MLISATTSLMLADMDGHMDWGDGWWIAMMAGMVLFWALVILGILWIVREMGGRGDDRKPPAGHDDPLAILDRRFAEGAISPEEYRERRTVLGEHLSQD